MDLHLGRTDFGRQENKGKLLSREDAEVLFNEWVLNPRLKLHMRQVGGLLAAWASEKLLLDQTGSWKWELAGLLHDADWDQWPEQHCRKIIEHLESLDIDPEVIRAIASHGPAHFGVEPVTDLDKMLYAFDELSGLIHAYALMRPGGYEGMDAKGVKKRLKEKTFAAGVNRDDIDDACRRASLDLTEFITFIIPHQARITAAYS